MSKSAVALKWLLLVGAIYFLGISIASMVRIKVPMLYIYYNVPSYGYEDRIISFLSFGWSVFLFTASMDPVGNRDLVKAVLISGFGAVLGLQVINRITDFHRYSAAVRPGMFRMETLGFTLYVAALIVAYFWNQGKRKAPGRITGREGHS